MHSKRYEDLKRRREAERREGDFSKIEENKRTNLENEIQGLQQALAEVTLMMIMGGGE